MTAYRSYLALAATLTVIAVNAAANTLRINGYATGELSDMNPTGFTPAGWVFAIWSLIYTGLMAFSLAFIFGSEGVKTRAQSVLVPYLVSAVANVAWLFAWHYRQVGVSFILMLVILGSLTVIYRRLWQQTPPTLTERLLVHAPFSLYIGWITTATLANLGALFFAEQFYPVGLAMDQWALVTVVLAVAIYVGVGVLTQDIVYCAVFIWASIGIALKPIGITEPVKLAAGAGTSALCCTVLWIAVMGALRWRTVRTLKA